MSASPDADIIPDTSPPLKLPKHRRKRTLITLATKRRIIETSVGKTSSQVGKLFDLPSSTIRSILQSKNIILGALERGAEEKRSCIQPVKNENLDNAIFDWVRTTREGGSPLSGPILKVNNEFSTVNLNFPIKGKSN